MELRSENLEDKEGSPGKVAFELRLGDGDSERGKNVSRCKDLLRFRMMR